jgi:hypothetical protein
MKPQKTVTPAKAGVQGVCNQFLQVVFDSQLRGELLERGNDLGIKGDAETPLHFNLVFHFTGQGDPLYTRRFGQVMVYLDHPGHRPGKIIRRHETVDLQSAEKMVGAERRVGLCEQLGDGDRAGQDTAEDIHHDGQAEALVSA